MENAPRLYDAVFTLLGQPGRWRDLRHLKTLTWMVVGLLLSSKIGLTDWLDYVCSRAVFAQSVQRRFSRWLNNPRIQERKLYAPLIRRALSEWNQSRLILALDTSVLWNRYCLIQISLIYRGRAIPLMWKVMAHKSSSVAHSDYSKLIYAVATVLPEKVEVLFLADRGFADLKLFQQLRRFNWHYRIRIKSSFYVYLGKHGRQISDYCLRPGEACFLNAVRLTRERYGIVHVALAHHAQSQERWIVVSDQPTCCETFVEYGWRFDIEEGFLDEKSNGFQLESSQIRGAKMLSRLCLVLAVATLYLSSIGTDVVESGARRFVDPHWFRGSSYLKIGWRWIRQALVHAWTLPQGLTLSDAADPDPALASRVDANKRRTTFQFRLLPPESFFSSPSPLPKTP
ncbi:transposase [Leptolyngbya sp. AN03gr2]|uniref:transposase n=1 Tax=unclassified Leptolyngbya TaxID=2650499 RepID=UPI003D321F2E